ncbi:cold shock domain-containing protein [Candidatus Poribacteria bacterium]|nr:cold shock domain-containing protein [Candidatus Poribacteria bacterium]MYH84065.1 cold shock domain-containing protein [Candidatus Poribacteria bacterium]MYK94912.1 cold shock domain-containing protein [Candidatus Poribacteria bacterium]
MPTGRIKYYNFDKGFGFIAQDSSDADVFLHSSAIKQPEYEELRVGQRVKYNVVEGEKGLVAQNVEVLLTPTERRWLRQGKAIIPRGYAGFPGQNQGQFVADEAASGTGYKTHKSEPISERSDRDVAVPPSRPTSKPRNQPAATKDLSDTDESTQDKQEQSSKQLSFGDLYILKQINFETSMFFALYNAIQLPATVLEMTLSSLTLNSNGKEQQIAKTDVKYCYKDFDAEKVQAAIEIDEDVKAQALTQLPPDTQPCEVDTEAVRHARKNGAPIEITLREGEIFRGTVDWVSPYEIKLILENGAKVVIFRPAVYNLSVD